MIKEFYCEIEDKNSEYHMHDYRKILLRYDINDIDVSYSKYYGKYPPVFRYILSDWDHNKLQILDQSGKEIKSENPFEGIYYPFIDFIETDVFGIPKTVRINNLFYGIDDKGNIHRHALYPEFVKYKVIAVSSKPMNNRLEYYREKYSEFFKIKNRLFYVECEESKIRKEKEYLLNKKNNFLSDFNS